MQEQITSVEEKELKSYLPITYVSGTFVISQKNWASVMKKTHVIYIAIMKLLYCLYDVKVTLKCDIAPLHKFLTAHTINSKGNK